jgi:hypothetical protein
LRLPAPAFAILSLPALAFASLGFAAALPALRFGAGLDLRASLVLGATFGLRPAVLFFVLLAEVRPLFVLLAMILLLLVLRRFSPRGVLATALST